MAHHVPSTTNFNLILASCVDLPPPVDTATAVWLPAGATWSGTLASCEVSPAAAIEILLAEQSLSLQEIGRRVDLPLAQLRLSDIIAAAMGGGTVVEPPPTKPTGRAHLDEDECAPSARCEPPQGEPTGSRKERIKARMVELLGERAYSDVALAAAFKAEGVNIARRTLSTYRQELGMGMRRVAKLSPPRPASPPLGRKAEPVLTEEQREHRLATLAKARATLAAKRAQESAGSPVAAPVAAPVAPRGPVAAPVAPARPALPPGRPYQPHESYVVGETIEHPSFGRGRVVDVQGAKFRVAFEAGSTKILACARQDVATPAADVGPSILGHMIQELYQ